MSIDIILPENAPEWDWQRNNGTAGALATQDAYNTLVARGRTVSFWHGVWNDLVNLVNDTRVAVGLSWNDEYAPYSRMILQGPDYLTANMFNALSQNVKMLEVYVWKWASKTGAGGYTGRDYFRGVETHGIGADEVFGWYFLEMTKRLNFVIKILKDSDEAVANGSALEQTNTYDYARSITVRMLSVKAAALSQSVDVARGATIGVLAGVSKEESESCEKATPRVIAVAAGKSGTKAESCENAKGATIGIAAGVSREKAESSDKVHGAPVGVVSARSKILSQSSDNGCGTTTEIVSGKAYIKSGSTDAARANTSMITDAAAIGASKSTDLPAANVSEAIAGAAANRSRSHDGSEAATISPECGDAAEKSMSEGRGSGTLTEPVSGRTACFDNSMNAASPSICPPALSFGAEETKTYSAVVPAMVEITAGRAKNKSTSYAAAEGSVEHMWAVRHGHILRIYRAYAATQTGGVLRIS